MEREPKQREDIFDEKEVKASKIGTDPNYKHKYYPHLLVFHAVIQFFAFFGAYEFLFKAKWVTLIWGK